MPDNQFNTVSEANMNSMKKYSILLLLLLVKAGAIACEACKKQQPEILQGITHGAGPGSQWDYLIVAVMVMVTVYVLYATVKCIIRPSERNEQHIKRMILNDARP